MVDVSALDAKTRSRRKPPTGKGSLLTSMLMAHPERGVWTVRIARLIEERGSHFGEPMFLEVQVFLTGEVLRSTYTARQYLSTQEEIMSVPQALGVARTGKITDWGRFEQACIALAQSAETIAKDDNATAEQQEELLQGYQGLIAWREELRKMTENADAALDLANSKVRSAFS